MKKVIIILVGVNVIMAQVITKWIVHYDGPDEREDVGYDVVVGVSGNVYVAGGSWGYNPFAPRRLLIKYDSLGNECWVFRDTLTGCFGRITLDKDENIYVAGFDVMNDSIIITKFDMNGNIIWHKALSPGGNPGISEMVWSRDSNYLYLVGGFFSPLTDWDMILIKCSINGSIEWIQTYDYEGFDDYASDIALDQNGNIYITGTIQGMSIGTCYGTLKYDQTGNLLWVRYYDGHGWGGGGGASSIGIDNFGNIYVTGRHEDTVSATAHWDYATIKYDSMGNEIWVRRYNGTGNSRDEAIALVVDDSANIYVTGVSIGDTSGEDIVTIKYDSQGNEKWIARFAPPYPQGWASYDEPHDMTIDEYGNIYIVGVVDPDSSGSTYWEYCTIKYDPQGNVQWVMIYDGASGEGGDIPHAIEIYKNAVFVTGRSDEKLDGYQIWDCTTIKYVETTSIKEKLITTSKSPPLRTNSFIIYNILGRKIKFEEKKKFFKNLASGVYFMISKSGKIRLKIFKIK